MHNRKKSLLLQHARLLSKNNVVQKRQKSDDQSRLALFLYLLHERTQVLITLQRYHVALCLVGTCSVGSKTKV